MRSFITACAAAALCATAGVAAAQQSGQVIVHIAMEIKKNIPSPSGGGLGWGWA